MTVHMVVSSGVSCGFTPSITPEQAVPTLEMKSWSTNHPDVLGMLWVPSCRSMPSLGLRKERSKCSNIQSGVIALAFAAWLKASSAVL